MKTLLAFLVSALFSPILLAQNEVVGQTMSKSDQLNYLVLGSALVLFAIFVIRSFYVATVTLREYGGEMKFQFPMLKGMTKNPKSLGIVIVFLVICSLLLVMINQP